LGARPRTSSGQTNSAVELQLRRLEVEEKPFEAAERQHKLEVAERQKKLELEAEKEKRAHESEMK